MVTVRLHTELRSKQPGKKAEAWMNVRFDGYTRQEVEEVALDKWKEALKVIDWKVDSVFGE